MNKISFAIQQWWRKVGLEYHRKKLLREESEIKTEANHRLQVREFDGGIYLCLDEIPILSKDDISMEPEKAVGVAREYFVDYMYLKRYGRVTF